MSRVAMETVGSPRERASISRWIGSLLGLIGLLVGVPIVFLAVGVAPPLVHLGHLLVRPGLIVHHLGRPLTDSMVDDSVALAAWVAWLWLVLCVMVEIAATVRGRPPFRLPASRHVQSFVATLMGASLAVLPIGRSGLPLRLLAVPTSVQRVSGISPSVVQPRFSDGTGGDPNGVVTGSAQGPVLVPVDNAVPVPSPERAYTVKRGDTLWSIAESELGSPLRWHDIADLNYGRIQPDGESLTDAHWIYPGWELLLPTVVPGPVVELGGPDPRCDRLCAADESRSTGNNGVGADDSSCGTENGAFGDNADVGDPCIVGPFNLLGVVGLIEITDPGWRQLEKSRWDPSKR